MNRRLVALILALVAVNVFSRSVVSGWGPDRQTPGNPDGVVYGVAFNPTDNLSYCAWARQAAGGVYPFGNLYTTTEHRRLLIRPFFYLVGRLAAVLSLDPLAVLNALAVLAIPLFVLALAGVCRELGFDEQTGLVVVCLALAGGGISWVGRLLWTIGIGDALQVASSTGPDLIYYDLYPVTAFAVYPYHAVSLGVLALVSLLIVRAENPNRPLTGRRLLGLAGVSFCLAAIRPYEPLMVVGVYAVVLLITWLGRLSKPLLGTPDKTGTGSRFSPETALFSETAMVPILTRRAAIFASLLIGVLPLSGYAFWVSRQPVWDHFANQSTSLFAEADWTGGFFLLWLGALVGVLKPGDRFRTGGGVFFAAWGLAVAVLLLVLRSGLTKLCGGCTIPLAVLAGLAVRRLADHVGDRPLFRQSRVNSCAELQEVPRRSPWFRLVRIRLLPAGIVIAAFGSPLLAYLQFLRNPPRVDTELLAAVRAIRQHANGTIPTVLTDARTGAYLPGLGSLRVYCGHWALTDGYRVKARVLRQLGLSTGQCPVDPVASPEAVKSAARDLLQQVEQGEFQYLLVRKDAPLVARLGTDWDDCRLYEGDRYRAAQINGKLRRAVERQVQTALLDTAGTRAVWLGPPPQRLGAERLVRLGSLGEPGGWGS